MSCGCYLSSQAISPQSHKGIRILPLPLEMGTISFPASFLFALRTWSGWLSQVETLFEPMSWFPTLSSPLDFSLTPGHPLG